jgi:hypothetical protein
MIPSVRSDDSATYFARKSSPTARSICPPDGALLGRGGRALDALLRRGYCANHLPGPPGSTRTRPPSRGRRSRSRSWRRSSTCPRTSARRLSGPAVGDPPGSLGEKSRRARLGAARVSSMAAASGRLRASPPTAPRRSLRTRSERQPGALGAPPAPASLKAGQRWADRPHRSARASARLAGGPSGRPLVVGAGIR